MNKKDYLGAVTAKVFDSDAKKSVISELEVHIDEKTDFFREIGYDDEASEEKAIDAMGETEEVASQFGMLHNDFYNPAADIILFVIWIAMLGGGYYLLKEYIFCDIGMSSVILGASCLSFSLMAGYCALSLFKNKLLPVILSFFGIGATGVFNYFILLELDKKMGADLQGLIDFVLKTEIPSSTNYPDKNKVIAVISALLLFAVIRFVFSLAYNIKVKLLANNRFDNKLMHMFIRLSTLIAAVTLALSIFFGVKCYFDLNSIKNEYYDAYDYVIEMSEKCDTKEDIIAFVNNGEYPLEEDLDKDGNLEGYSYAHNLVWINIVFEDVSGKDEIKEEKKEAIDKSIAESEDLVKSYLSLSDDFTESAEYKNLMNEYKKAMSKSLKNAVEREYLSQTFCTIYLSPRLSCFENSYDKVSTSFLEIKGDDEYALRNPEISKMNTFEKYDYYKKIQPAKLDVNYYISDLAHCSYDFEYVLGSGKFKHIENYSAYKPNEKIISLYDEIDRVAEILSSEKKMSNSDIAKKTGAKVEMPEISREELEEQMSVLGSLFDSMKEFVLEQYDNSIKYRFDDWYFIVSGNSYQELYAYDNFDSLIRTKTIRNEPKIKNFEGDDGQKKVRIDGVYYDKLGYGYSLADYAPYYTSDGKRYYYYCKTIKDETNTIGDIKEYYITDRKGEFYKADNAFIDESGYICFNVANLSYDEQSKTYKSSDGRKYTKAFETSWDENGNLIFTDDKYETTNSLY